MVDPYIKLARTVDKLLARYGKDCEVVHTLPGEYDPGTGSVTPGEEIIYAARAMESGYEVENIPDTLIQTGNKVGMLKINDPAFTGEITLSMKIRLVGDKLRVLSEIQPVMPGHSCLYWKFVAAS